MLIIRRSNCINPLNAELNLFCHLLSLLGVHLILHVNRIRVNTASGVVFSVSDCPLCTPTPATAHLYTGRSLTENTIQFDLMMSTELLETCRGL